MKLSEMNLSRRSQTAIEALIRSPLVEEAVAQADQRRVAERKAILAQLGALPAAHAKARAAAAAKAAAADKAVIEAKQALANARDAQMAATGANVAASCAEEHEAERLKRELEESADPRLLAFARALHDVKQTLNGQLKLEPLLIPSNTPYSADRVEFVLPEGTNEAWRALDVAREQALGMRMDPLSAAEVTRALRLITERLRPVLARVGLAPPRVLDEHVLEPAQLGPDNRDEASPLEAQALGLLN